MKIASGTPFKQAQMMMARINTIAASMSNNPLMMQAALSELGPYQGRGKGRTKMHVGGGTRAAQRVALKKRNQARHRRACK